MGRNHDENREWERRDKLENDDYFNFKSNMMFEYSNLIRCCERENTKKEMEERPSKREREFI